MKRIERLSSRAVANFTAPGMYADGRGLYLQVRASENGGPPAKSWVFRFVAPDCTRERYMGLGSLSDVSLAKARDLAGDARDKRRAGIDPITARDAAKAASAFARSKMITFREAAEAYIAAHRVSWQSIKHARQWPSTLEAYAYPVIGALDVRAIDHGHVLGVLEPIWIEKTDTAKKLQNRIETVLDWCKAHKYREGENPARWRGHLEHMLPAPTKVRANVRPVRHHPSLPYIQASAFLSDLRTCPGISAAAIEFVIFTVARINEALRAKPAEFDLVNKVWTVPAERMGKTKRDHRVPLPDAAVKLIRPLLEAAGTDDFIFLGPRGKLLSDVALSDILRRMKYVDDKGEKITTHGFRATFKTWATEYTKFPREVIETALAHTVGSKVETAYQRGDLFEKRRKLMAAWADYCTKPAVAEPNKVVALRA
jgi:integrase